MSSQLVRPGQALKWKSSYSVSISPTRDTLAMSRYKSGGAANREGVDALQRQLLATHHVLHRRRNSVANGEKRT